MEATNYKALYDEVLKELPLKLWAFYYMMDDTTTNEDDDYDENGPSIAISELWGYYYNELLDIEERFEDFEHVGMDDMGVMDEVYEYRNDMYHKWDEGKIKMGVLAKTLQSDIRNGTLRYTLPYVM
jgi:hypothetical protein